jgi:hypothetical protein
MNICIVFNLGGEKAYLSRATYRDGSTSYQRAKEYQFGYHEFKDVNGWKASIKRYTEQYGAPEKVILNGNDFTGYNAETLCEFIVNEAR